MFEIIILAIMMGVLLSFAMGPLFFALINTSITHGFKAGRTLVFGIFTVDFIYVVSIVLGLQLFIEEILKMTVVSYIGIGVIFLYAIYLWFKSNKIEFKETGDIKKRNYFFKGMILALSNPGLFFYWLTIAGNVGPVIQKTFISPQIFLLIFFSVVLSIQIVLDVTKCYFASKVKRFVNRKFLILLNKITALIIFGAGIFLIYYLY